MSKCNFVTRQIYPKSIQHFAVHIVCKSDTDLNRGFLIIQLTQGYLKRKNSEKKKIYKCLVIFF